MTDVMPEAPEALRHLNNNDSVTPLSLQQKCFKPQSPSTEVVNSGLRSSGIASSRPLKIRRGFQRALVCGLTSETRSLDIQPFTIASKAGGSLITSAEPFLWINCFSRKSENKRVTVSRVVPITSAIS